MKTLHRYLKNYWDLVFAALILAAINQIFSMLDPLIFRHVIDSYATRYREYSSLQFLKGVSLLLSMAVGVAFVSRVAKNFQDYFVNVITQRIGARLYSDGIRHSLELPYALFEDQRSGETLGKLQKVRNDVEKFVRREICRAAGEYGFHHGNRSGVRHDLRGSRALVYRAGVPADGSAAGRAELRAEPQDQGGAEADRARNQRAGGSDYRIAAQH
jgi:ABC-type multidrug transport system fused ATPase/permease subunit